MEEQKIDLATAITQYEEIQGATEQPWFCNKFDRDVYDCGYMEIGPYNLEEEENPETNNYHEDCLATFYGDNHDAEANAKLAVASVNLVPRLIARIRELEAKTSTELSIDVINAIDALNKWQNRV